MLTPFKRAIIRELESIHKELRLIRKLMYKRHRGETGDEKEGTATLKKAIESPIDEELDDFEEKAF